MSDLHVSLFLNPLQLLPSSAVVWIFFNTNHYKNKCSMCFNLLLSGRGRCVESM